MLTHTFACPLPSGLHARPASAVERACAGLAADLSLENLRNGRIANAKSVLELIGLDLRMGDGARLVVSGMDAEAAHARLVDFFTLEFPACDAPIVVAKDDGSGALPLPPRLATLAPAGLRGQVAVSGTGVGVAVVMGGGLLPEKVDAKAGSPAEEHDRFLKAQAKVGAALQDKARHTGLEAELAGAHLSILRDPQLAAAVGKGTANGQAMAQAVIFAGRHAAEVLRKTGNPVLEERAMDVEDVCAQLLAAAYGAGALGQAETKLAAPSVVVADHLTPSQLLALDRGFLKGLVLGPIGQTSHTVILARAFGIPTLLGITDAAKQVKPGAQVAVDGEAGLLALDCAGPVADYYARALAAAKTRQERQLAGARAHGCTKDGRGVAVAANIASDAEAQTLVEAGADGVGLFRTEMLFLERETPPSEDEQAAIYERALRGMAGRPVIIRLLDIGGDKPLPYLKLPAEENPFLGVRGIRLLQKFPDLLKAQLRALLRAGVHGDLWVMVPMIAEPSEMAWTRAQLEGCRAELAAEGKPHAAGLKLGMMVETPAAAFAVGAFAGCADFFSIGTNDLTQYFFAADRGNGAVVPLCAPRSPRFLALLKHACDAAKAHGRWIGMCGEMAGDPVNLPLLAGLGLDEISMAPARIPEIKARLSKVDAAAARALLEECAKAADASAVEKMLEASPVGHAPEPMLTAALVRDSQAQTKEEALRELAELFYAQGRASSAGQLERALAAREHESTTGFGGGVAIPHCKSAAVEADSIAILRLREGIAWGAVDGEPVRFLISLAMRGAAAGNTHLKVFAMLSRKLVNDEFRETLLAQETAADIVALLDAEVIAKVK